jgi:hypothetical protein
MSIYILYIFTDFVLIFWLKIHNWVCYVDWRVLNQKLFIIELINLNRSYVRTIVSVCFEGTDDIFVFELPDECLFFYDFKDFL